MDEPLEDEMHFEASNRQYIVLGAVSALLVVLLTAVREVDDVATYDVNVWLTVFFAIVTLIAASAALFKRSWLKLDREGFSSSEFKALGHIPWRDVSDFKLYRQRVGRVPGTHQVAFKLTARDRQVAGRLSGLMTAGTIRITEHYRLKGSRLVEILNAFRDRALSEEGAAS
ncbi:hypothetical protein [Henriciella mobilis]|uniref:Uncharacterized protein n=1 Tax=Henriciella mobilis TaxID=2305467 RepID=A0A399RFP0_9PROT|nr:hypothetical protein [Henriciella mobilis]RIJ29314.1 hypothetical protein D1223_10240 [Henriciella mobilis]